MLSCGTCMNTTVHRKKNQAAYKYTYGSLITICSFGDRDTKNSGDEEDNSGTEFDEESNRDIIP